MEIRIKWDYFKAGLQIHFPKSGVIPSEERSHLGFEVGLGSGYFTVPADM